MPLGFGLGNFSRSTENVDLTIPPLSPNDMETKAPLMWEDRKSSNRNSGHLYGFMIVAYDATTGHFDYEDLGGATGKAVGPATPIAPNEFFFPVPPRSITMSEPTTTLVQPTMNRGYTIETQGILIRSLNVSGTTGFRPASVGATTRGVFGQTAAAVSGLVNSAQNLVSFFSSETAEGAYPTGDPTGYFNFMQLRNLMRKYQWLRAHMTSADTKVPYLVWVNYHEFEFWVCELSSFDMTRSSSSPLTFNYSIGAQCLFKLSELPPGQDILGFLADVYQGFQTIRTAVNLSVSIYESVLEVPNALLGDAQALCIQGIDTLNRIMRIVTSTSDFSSSWRANNNSLASLATELVATWDDLIITMGNESAWVGGNPNSYDNIETMHLISVSARLAAELAVSFATMQSGGIPQTNRSQDSTEVSNGSQDPAAARTTVVLAGESIEDISERETGNPDNWIGIADMNDLQPPYISSTGLEGTLGPGDTILIPDAPSVRNANLVLASATTPANYGNSQNISQLTAAAVYGIDYKVQYRNNGYQVFEIDFEPTQNGDIGTVEGVANFKQALNNITNTEKKTLKSHLNYGFPRQVGSRSSASQAALWAVEVEQTLKADPRIAAVNSIAVLINGDIFAGRASVQGAKKLAQFPVTTIQGGSR